MSVREDILAFPQCICVEAYLGQCAIIRKISTVHLKLNLCFMIYAICLKINFYTHQAMMWGKSYIKVNKILLGLFHMKI